MKNIEFHRFEKIPATIVNSSLDGCQQIASEICTLIKERNLTQSPTVLGLATGSTPTGIYRELIRIHKEEGLSFSNVITFNLDEYYNITSSHPESYNLFMQEQLFDHLDIPTKNINIPDGTVERTATFAYCQDYENRILDAGGIDIQVLGIGRTGHIGFNEPGSSAQSRTRLVHLDSLTKKDAARDFLGEENVPRYALTMGVGTILDSERIYLLAWGRSKASILALAVEGEPSEALPASLLQSHPNIEILADQAAASELTRLKRPWLVRHVDWTSSLIRSAVSWLSANSAKPILKLLDDDYTENGLADLLTQHGPAYDLNIRIFNEIQHTLTGWPGGKTKSSDEHRPERAEPHPKRSLILAPEPFDDVIGMGGTIHRLVDQGHEVIVAYLTSGNLAVPDADASKAAELVVDLAELSDDCETEEVRLAKSVLKELGEKADFATDSPNVRSIKGLIRRGEAKIACEICGLSGSKVRFLSLPFYERGKYRQFKLSGDDTDLLKGLFEEIQPHQLYFTGALSEPSTVQANCYQSMRRALLDLSDSPWIQNCYMWQYREASQEWDIQEIDMAVPLSPTELTNKIQGIYQHQTQRRQAPTSDRASNDIWRQAEECDRRLAETYDNLGLAEYEAIEGFKRYSLI